MFDKTVKIDPQVDLDRAAIALSDYMRLLNNEPTRRMTFGMNSGCLYTFQDLALFVYQTATAYVVRKDG
jgi:hypothetical protein